MRVGREVVVTGMGVISGLGRSVNEFFGALFKQHSFGKRLAHIDSEILQTLSCQIGVEVPNSEEFFISELHDRQPRFVRMAVEAARSALLQAGLDTDKERELGEAERFGVSLGVGMSSMEDFVDNAHRMQTRGPRRVSPYFVPRLLVNMASAHTSATFGLRGPSLSPSSACTSSSHAIGDAARMIACGSADRMLAGGAEACIHPLALAGFGQCRALSTHFNACPQLASRPFDSTRDGFVMGEGAAVLVLEELETARARSVPILAHVAGYGLSSDAYHVTAPRSDGSGAQQCMRAALHDADLAPKDISYLNAHATSTPVGDAAEANAIVEVFGPRGVAVSSTKGATGHLLGAAGVVEAVASIMALCRKTLPPNVNLERIGLDKHVADNIDLLRRARELDTMEAVMSNSFGFGGTNASLLFTKGSAQDCCSGKPNLPDELE